jgi:hypothetical protein
MIEYGHVSVIGEVNKRKSAGSQFQQSVLVVDFYVEMVEEIVSEQANSWHTGQINDERNYVIGLQIPNLYGIQGHFMGEHYV